jgi:hypothetical protein
MSVSEFALVPVIDAVAGEVGSAAVGVLDR